MNITDIKNKLLSEIVSKALMNNTLDLTLTDILLNDVMDSLQSMYSYNVLSLAQNSFNLSDNTLYYVINNVYSSPSERLCSVYFCQRLEDGKIYIKEINPRILREVFNSVEECVL